MTRIGSANVKVLMYGGYDLLGTSTECTIDKEVPLEDTTALGDANITQYPSGFLKTSFDLQGFYDDAANASNDALVGPANNRILCVGIEGNTLGKKFFGASSALEYKYNRTIKVGSLHRANASFACSGKVDEGLIHQTLATLSATTTGTGVDGTASSSNGGAGYLQVKDLTLGGATSITVTIQDSADNATGWTNIVTFTDVTTAPQGQYVAITGTVRRYTRALVTVNGAGTPSFTIFVGFARR